MTRNRQAGSAMFVAMVVITALLTAGMIAIYVGAAETRSSDYVATSRRSLFCAEAGIAASRGVVGTNYGSWGLVLDADVNNDPAWYPMRGYLDDDHDPNAPPDYEVTIRDNDDELPPMANNLNRDNDLKVFVVSRCLKYPEMPRTVSELIEYEGGGNVYRNMSGQGASNTGNNN